MLTANESKSCDAIVRFIETRAKARRSNLRLHDDHPDPTRRVELTVEIGAQLYAIEHTLVEPFPDFMSAQYHSEPKRRRALALYFSACRQ